MHGVHRAVARPRPAADRERARGGMPHPGFGTGDDGLDRHRTDDLHVLLGHLGPRGHRIAGHAVGKSRHLGSVVHLIADPESPQPLAARRGGEARSDHAERESVVGRQRFAVHFPSQQGGVVHRLGYRDPPRNRNLVGISAQVGILPVVGDVDGGVEHPGSAQHIAETHPGIARTTHGAEPPLVSRRSRLKGRSPVARALEDESPGYVFESRSQVVEREFQRVSDLAIDPERPTLQASGERPLRQASVVSYEVFVVGRVTRIEVGDQGLGVHRPLAQNPEAALPEDRARGLGGSALQGQGARAGSHRDRPEEPPSRQEMDRFHGREMLSDARLPAALAAGPARPGGPSPWPSHLAPALDSAQVRFARRAECANQVRFRLAPPSVIRRLR